MNPFQALVTTTLAAVATLSTLPAQISPADEPEPDGLALWVEVVGANTTEFVYDLYFQAPEHADPDDLVIIAEDLTVIVPDGSREFLDGATLDVSRDLLAGGYQVKFQADGSSMYPTIRASESITLVGSAGLGGRAPEASQPSHRRLWLRLS